MQATPARILRSTRLYSERGPKLECTLMKTSQAHSRLATGEPSGITRVIAATCMTRKAMRSPSIAISVLLLAVYMWHGNTIQRTHVMNDQHKHQERTGSSGK